MDSAKFKTVLKDVYWQVFERHAFLLPDEMSCSLLSSETLFLDGEFFHIKMHVKGEVTGTFHLVVPQAIGLEIAENLAGMQDDEAVKDAINEMLNIIGANVISETFGKELVFEISIPEFGQFDSTAWTLLKQLSLITAASFDGAPSILAYETKAA